MNELALSRLQLRPRPSDRALLICVVCSIALHAAVLMLSPRHKEGGAAPGEPVMKARLMPRETVQSPEPLPPVEVQKPVPPPQTPKPQVPQPTPKPAQQTPLTAPTPSPTAPRIAAPEPAPAPSAPPPTATVQGPAAAPLAPSAPGATPRGASGEATSGDTAGNVDEAALGKLKSNLAGVIRNKSPQYPAVARQQGWEGRVTIRLKIDANGRSSDYQVILSSQHDVLDKNAEQRIRNALFEAWTRTPEVRGKAFSFEVITDYKLTASE